MQPHPKGDRNHHSGNNNVVQSSLIALMVTTQVAGLMFIFQRITPQFPTLVISALALVVSWEAVATTRWLAHRHRLLVNNTLYRCAELMTVLVAVRVAVWMANGGLPNFEQLLKHGPDPTLLIFDRVFFLGLAVVVIAWVRACQFGSVFHELGVREEEATLYALYRTNPHDFPAGPPLDRNRSAIARTFQHSWAWGGVFLIVCASLASFDVANIETGQPVPTSYITLTLLVYFASGFWLASAARHQALSAKWLLSATGRRGGVVTRWRKSTGWLVGGIATVVSFLPAGGILPVAEVLHFIVNSILVFTNFVLLLFTKLIAWLTSLFNLKPTKEIIADDLPGDLLPNVPQAHEFAVSKTLTTPLDLGPLLWLILAASVVFAFIYFAQERSRAWPGELRNLLIRIWYWLLENRQSEARGDNSHIYSDDDTGGKTLKKRRRVRRTRRFLLGLRHDEQIRELYRRLVEQAAKRYTPRSPSQTPLEFEQVLAKRWPEQTSSISDFTHSFLKARYSQSPIHAEEVSAVKQIYRRLRAAFRSKLVS